VQLEEVRERIRQNLQTIEPSYATLGELWNVDPLRITLLPVGAFRNYYETRQRDGADLAHLKPPHMNPPDSALNLLTGLH